MQPGLKTTAVEGVLCWIGRVPTLLISNGPALCAACTFRKCGDSFSLWPLLCACETWCSHRRLRISKGNSGAHGCLRPHQGRTWADGNGREKVGSAA